MKYLEDLANKMAQKFVAERDHISISKAYSATPRGQKSSFIMPLNRELNKAGAILIFQWYFDTRPYDITISVKVSRVEKTENVLIKFPGQSGEVSTHSPINVFSNTEKLIQVYESGLNDPGYGEKILEILEELIKNL